MAISLFDLFSVGIGPSSSHTVGPMVAANAFLEQLKHINSFHKTDRIKVELYGSLALTGTGHAIEPAILNGLEGKHPETIDPNSFRPRMNTILKQEELILDGEKKIVFILERDFLLHQKKQLPKHTNGMRYTAYNKRGKRLLSEVYYSVGGGFIVTEAQFDQSQSHKQGVPFPFATAQELIAHCKKQKLTISELMLENEHTWHNTHEVHERILSIAAVMENCIDAGCKNRGNLPGGLNVKRRAPDLYHELTTKKGVQSVHEEIDVMNRLNLYAIAVNEENAACGRIVTAPTNGAAGIIPAVLKYSQEAHHKLSDEDTYNYFLTAGAIAILYKKGASISGAEVGCQGEIGVAASMAAAGLTAVLGGSIEQIENAAEIAIEHHLGLTCDPIDGLVQIPCIERNAMGAVKAVNAARLALLGDGKHFVSLDKAIQTMKQTGEDMQSIYKETSLGGLAVNHPEC